MGISGQGEQLWRALAISLVLHLVLLWPVAAPRLSEQAAAVLTATLRPLAAAPVVAPQSPPAVTRPLAHAKPQLPVPPPMGTLPASPVVAVAPTPTSTVAASAAAMPASATTIPASIERSAIGTALPAARTDSLGGGMASEGADPEGLRTYRLALAREARRFKRYPERALLAGIGGTAEVRVEHGSDSLPVTRLAHSSGDAALDAAALAMVQQAAPRTSVPEALRGRNFAVSLPVVFDATAE